MSLLFSTRSSGVEVRRLTLGQKFFAFWINHVRQAMHSLGELWRTPMASMMTVAVLGLSLTLPVTLHVVVKNVQSINHSFDEAAEISLFLESNLSNREVKNFIKRLEIMPEVSSVSFIAKDDALQEFKDLSGFGEALHYLDSNPLPNVILVTPSMKFRGPQAAKRLLHKLESTREVDIGKLDIEWLERLNAVVRLMEEIVYTVALLLLCAVVLIIGNTIRLSIMNKKEEIIVMKLVGATASFIQRPFLYTGMWFGLAGGMLSFIVVTMMLWWLESAIGHVAGIYGGQFTLTGLLFSEFLVLVGMAIGLGLLGSWVSVFRHIKEIEPDKI